MFTPRSFGKAGVEAYAAYALRAWLARDQAISGRTRRFAKWSAICSFALGMAGQVAYHLMAQAGLARAPWAITTIVSCPPVLVLGMGTALAHMLRADAGAAEASGSRTGQPAVLRSVSWSPQDQDGPGRGRPEADRGRPVRRDQNGPAAGPHHGGGITEPGLRPAGSQVDQARIVARRLAAAGRPVSRRGVAQRRGHRLQRGPGRPGAHVQRRAGKVCRQRVSRPGVRRAGLLARTASGSSTAVRRGSRRHGRPGSGGRCRAPAQRAVPVVRGCTGQLLQRRGLELADALAADLLRDPDSVPAYRERHT